MHNERTYVRRLIDIPNLAVGASASHLSCFQSHTIPGSGLQKRMILLLIEHEIFKPPALENVSNTDCICKFESLY